MEKLQKAIVVGSIAIKQALATFGSVVEKDMAQTITRGIKPDIADSTRQAKLRSLKKQRRKPSGVGFTPLIETGRLKGAITHDVRGV